MFRVVYPAAVSIDANDFNNAFKTAIKREQFFNVEQMIIADQLNQYRRANIMYSDLGSGKKKASIKHESVPYSTVAPYLGVTIGADGTAQPGMAMPLGPGLPPIIVPLGGKAKEEPKPAATGTAVKPEPAKDRVVIGPMGTMLVPAGGNVSASVVLPDSNQLVGVKPSLPIGTDGRPVAGLPMPFGVGGVPLMRPGLVPGSGTPMAMFPGAIPMGRVW